MKTIKNILLISAVVLFSGILAYSNLYAKKVEERLTSLTDEEMKIIDETTWKVYLTSDIKNSYFGAIQFTVFETDPMPLLKEQWKISKEANKGRELTKLDKIIDISTSWDLIFLNKTGAEVYLLKSISKAKDSSIVSANTKGGKKWLVSKSVQNKDGSVSAWMIPFDAKIGSTVKIELNENNKFNFDSI